MSAVLLERVASELALFAALGFLFFSIDDLAVDLLYFARRLTDGRERLSLAALPEPREPGWLIVTIPAWDEAAVIAPMLRATLDRLNHPDFTLMVGHYRNDPATAAAIRSVLDPRVVPVEVPVDGPTTKADCLNHLYAALCRLETEQGRSAKAIVLHDAEDLVHPKELRVFDALIERAALVQLPVVPLSDPASSWIAGHYCDEFAESHGKDLVVREAVGAAVPLAGVGCAIARGTLEALAMENDGKPFAGGSMTEDYEMGLRVGALGGRTLFARLADPDGRPGVVASRGHFPASLGAAVRQKARWVGGIAFAGWDRLGWRGSWGERWFRMRDRKGPLAAVLLFSGYLAALLWGQLALATSLGAPPPPGPSPLLILLLKVNTVLLLWRLFMRAVFTTRTYGLAEGLVSLPRVVVGNLIAILAAWRAFSLHRRGGPRQWDKTAHIFPKQAVRS
jgi:bacteriophage N4 adsorption protein B